MLCCFDAEYIIREPARDKPSEDKIKMAVNVDVLFILQCALGRGGGLISGTGQGSG